MGLICCRHDLYAQACVLSKQYGLPILEIHNLEKPGFHLCLDYDGLSLQQGGCLSHKKRMRVQVDFVQGANAHRRQFGGGLGQDIARAIGVTAYKPRVLDATAGLGRDAFVLATLGCHVTACERHPVVAALLADGLSRAALNEETRDIIQRIQLHHGSSHESLMNSANTTQQHDVVYLDPMFVHNEKDKAQVKKDMQAFRILVGQDQDADELLERALMHARCRVVVKRARKAAPLNNQQPSYSLTGKANRFDVYAKAKVEAPS